MSYNPVTDFMGLLRRTSGGVRTESMPGLDFVVSALARGGLISLSVGQTAPIVNQPSTAWFKPASPSWTAEGLLYLWNAITAEYELATPSLWAAFLGSVIFSYSFQTTSISGDTILDGTSLMAIQRAAPTATALTLPHLTQQWQTGRKLQIVDFSTSVVRHLITLTTPDGATIMQQPSWILQSTADQLTGIMLTAVPELNSWVIAP